MEKPDSLITETLLQTRRQSDAVTAISDSALKVVLSYYPVCRCQRTSPELRRGKLSAHFRHKKTQFCVRLEFVPAALWLQRRRVRLSCRDKIEFQFEVPKCTRTNPLHHLTSGVPPSGGIKK